MPFYFTHTPYLFLLSSIIQMCFGIFLSLINGLYFKKPYNIWFEFVPQICFMLSIFGYMCFLIFLKWCTNFVVGLLATLSYSPVSSSFISP